jgi:DNA repair exonuclease SbcCD ATPase subunit
MKLEEILETLIYIGKIAGSIGATLKCFQYVIEYYQNVKAYFQETPEDRLVRLKDELKQQRQNLTLLNKEYENTRNQRKDGFLDPLFFGKTSREEKKKWREEDEQYEKQKKLYEVHKKQLRDEIRELEKTLGYHSGCTIC